MNMKMYSQIQMKVMFPLLVAGGIAWCNPGSLPTGGEVQHGVVDHVVNGKYDGY